MLVLIQIANLISALLGDGRISCKVRAAVFNLLGNDLPVRRRAKVKGRVTILGRGLTLGEGSSINRECYFDMTAPITIGKNVGIGHHCVFITANHDLGPADNRTGPLRPAPIVIEDGVMISARVTILPGVTIGAGSIIGPCALVRKSLPPNSFFG